MEAVQLIPVIRV